ncbi:MAG TPA: hypothetical protein VGM65_07125 [Candidatus Udaeobacter sp.]|jgi:hypothetical protein
MKTLSGTFRFVVLGVIVTVVVVSCCNFPFPPILNTTSYAYLEIGRKLPGVREKRIYVEWKDQTSFENALKQIRSHNDKRASYCICVIKNPGDEPSRDYSYNDNDCSKYDCPSPFPGNIRTVKVTKSRAADNIAAGESAVNDPHLTYRVQSPYPGDIIAVLDALKK